MADDRLVPLSSCPIYHPRPKHCWVCGVDLPKRRRKYCTDACKFVFYNNHIWSMARDFALYLSRRTCRTCGGHKKLEVNHVIPRVGKGYGFGCHHHQDNLEVLCHACHVKVTNQQRQARMDKRRKGPPKI